MGTDTNQCNLPVRQLVDPLVNRETVHLILGALNRVLAAIHSPTDREVACATTLKCRIAGTSAYCRSDR
jgi:hypothetical protein